MTCGILALAFNRRVFAHLRGLLPAIGIATFMALLVFPANAQNRNASEIRGTVNDASGGVVPGVSVIATNTATGQKVYGTTNGSGIYDLPYVPPGTYNIAFVKDGYEKTIRSNILLTIDIVTVDALLHVGSTATNVTVDASSSALLQTESTEITATLSSQMLTDLPNNGAKWSNLFGYMPGIAQTMVNSNGVSGSQGTSTSGAYVGFNGSETNELSVVTDGATASTIQAHDAQWQNQPRDALAEVTILSGDFGADMGNGVAIVNLNIKGGTNKFHGSAWEVNQNNIFNTKPWGVDTEKGGVHFNKFGYSIGGPVFKNRLFFFQSSQWNPSSSLYSGNYTTFEDAVRGIGMPNGDSVFDPAIYGIIYDPATEKTVNGITTRQPFPNNTIPASRIDSVSKAVLKFYPQANRPYSNGYNYYWAGPSSTSDNVNYIYRIDYDITKANRISTTGSIEGLPYWDPSVGEAPNGFFGEGGKPYGFRTYQGTDAWTLSPNILNEARLSFFFVNRDYYCNDTNIVDQLGLKNTAHDIFPAINFSGGSRLPYGGSRCGPGGSNEHAYSISDSVSWLMGKHTLKFGGEVPWGSSIGVPSMSSGNFNFNGNATANPNINTATGVANPTGGSGIADFLLGAVDSWNNTDSVTPTIQNWTLQLYVQDAYKLRPNLTLNLGMRAVYQAGFHEIKNRYINFNPTLTNPATNTPGAVEYGTVSLGDSMENGRWFFQPRVGVSWSPRPNMVVHGGFGLYMVPWAATLYAPQVGNGYQGFGSLTQPAGNFDPVMKFSDPSPALKYPTNADLTPDLFNGQAIRWLPKDIPTQYQDQHTFGVQQLFRGGYLLDIAYVGTTIHHKLFQTDYTQNPQGQLGAPTHPFPQYSSILYMLRNGYGNYNALQIQGKKQFQNGLNYQIAYRWSKTMDTGSTAGLQSPNGLEAYQVSYSPDANYAAAVNDIRHMVNGGIIYQLPVGKGRMFLNQNALLDYVVGGWQLASAFQWHTGTPLTPVVASKPFADSGLYSGKDWYPNRIGSGKMKHPTLAQYYNVNDFTVPDNNTLGNSGRNIVYGPYYGNMDLGLSKYFRLPFMGEGGSFQVKVDMFDFMNNHPWTQPGASIYGTPALNEANNAGASYKSGGRSMQFEGHLRF